MWRPGPTSICSFCLLSADVDECSTSGVCSDGRCVNTEGSFLCECETGFTTNPERTACLGTDVNPRKPHTCFLSFPHFQKLSSSIWTSLYEVHWLLVVSSTNAVWYFQTLTSASPPAVRFAGRSGARTRLAPTAASLPVSRATRRRQTAAVWVGPSHYPFLLWVFLRWLIDADWWTDLRLMERWTDLGQIWGTQVWWSWITGPALLLEIQVYTLR